MSSAPMTHELITTRPMIRAIVTLAVRASGGRPVQ
jgi:hypothetical protein